MKFDALTQQDKRFSADAGIAIGPILFIIAVLGILATAIAAGSGSFTTSTTGESARTKASAMIDIGQNLKVGMDRVMARGLNNEGTELLDVKIELTETSTADDLFSPNGGGIAPPSVALAADPATDAWYYPVWVIPGIGTTNGSRVAVLRVTEAVCDEINTKLYSFAAGYAHTNVDDFGNFEQAIKYDGTKTDMTGADPVWPATMDGKTIGCLENSNATNAGFYFFQVIGID